MNYVPACRICHNEACLVNAGILKPITYFYCKTCKIEVDSNGWEVRECKKEEEKKGFDWKSMLELSDGDFEEIIF